MCDFYRNVIVFCSSSEGYSRTHIFGKFSTETAATPSDYIDKGRVKGFEWPV
jgi:hypothetical protein